MDITHITSLLGGIALFLYGMSIMGAGLEKLAGGKMQGVLQKLTSSTIKGVIFGTLITGVILTMIVLFVFFGDLRASLIVGISMPLSILLAVILLVQIAVVLCTSRYMKRMGGGK